MTEQDLVKVVRFINGYYSKDLKDDEVIALKRELKDISYQQFRENIEFPLLKKVDTFTVVKLHKIIEDYKELEELKIHLGIKSFDELYEN